MHNTQETNDEIDLIELFRIIGNKLNQLFNWINKLINFGLSNAIVLLITLIIGSAAGFFFSNKTDKSFSSTATLSSNFVINQIIFELIASIQQAIEDENSLFFDQNKLLTSKEYLNKIEFMPLNEDDDTLKNKKPFYLMLSSNVGAKLPEIQDEILNYISQNEYVKLNKEKFLSRHKKLLTEYQKELSSLDSLKNILKTIDKVKTINDKEGVIPYIDPTAVYEEQIKLIREKINIEERLMDQETIRIITPVMAKNKPDLSEKKSGAIFGLVLTFIVYIIIYRKREKWKIVRT